MEDPNSHDADRTIRVSMPLDESVVRGALKAAARHRCRPLFMWMIQLVGLFFIGISVFLAVRQGFDGRILLVTAAGLYLVLFKPARYWWNVRRSLKYLNTVGATRMEVEFAGDTMRARSSYGSSDVAYNAFTKVVLLKDYLLLYVHYQLVFVATDLLAKDDLERVVQRFRNAGVKVES